MEGQEHLTRLEVKRVQTSILYTILYACESWTLTTELEKRILDLRQMTVSFFYKYLLGYLSLDISLAFSDLLMAFPENRLLVN